MDSSIILGVWKTVVFLGVDWLCGVVMWSSSSAMGGKWRFFGGGALEVLWPCFLQSLLKDSDEGNLLLDVLPHSTTGQPTERILSWV